MYSYEKGIKNSTLAWRVKFIPFFCTSRRRRTDNLRFTHLHSKRHVDEICHAHAQPHQSRGSMEGWKDGRMEAWKHGRMEGWKDGRTEGWKDGRMEGWKDGKMEGWKDRPIQSSSNLLLSMCTITIDIKHNHLRFDR